MAAPRDSDSPRLAKLRSVLRDESLMAHVRADVEQWPPLSDEQRDNLAALLGHSTRRAGRRAARLARRRLGVPHDQGRPVATDRSAFIDCEGVRAHGRRTHAASPPRASAGGRDVRTGEIHRPNHI
jgi:hypothetical protein